MKNFIVNDKGQRISVQVDLPDSQKGLAFVIHGLGGYREQPHVEAMVRAFLDKEVAVVRFDAINSFGESDGCYQDATVTGYYQDFQQVIKWASIQSWYRMPFFIAGHSLGGMCAVLYAEQNASSVCGLIPISPVVSGRLSLDAHREKNQNELEMWESTGWLETQSADGKRIKRLPWSHMQNRLQYDLLQEASRINMPTLIIVGSADVTTPPDHAKILFDSILSKKTFQIIEDAPHTFRSDFHLQRLEKIISEWLGHIIAK
jgi:pimeloyl-ACP methyl ester carboxylesterase